MYQTPELENQYFLRNPQCKGKGRFSCALLWGKNQLRLKLLDLNIVLHFFLFATCEISSKSSWSSRFLKREFFSLRPCNPGLLVLVFLGLALCGAHFLAESKDSGELFHTDQKLFFRKTFCICRAGEKKKKKNLYISITDHI